ncbi:unnamed protein product, partial [Mesorhabditis spiculigera]
MRFLIFFFLAFALVFGGATTNKPSVGLPDALIEKLRQIDLSKISLDDLKAAVMKNFSVPVPTTTAKSAATKLKRIAKA